MRLLLFFVLLLALLSGCGSPVPARPPAVMSASPDAPPAAQPTATLRPSSTPPAPTATFTPLYTPAPSATPQPRPPANATALRLEIGAEYSPYYWLQVVSYPERYMGEKVLMQGIVLNVIDPHNFRMRLPDNAPVYIVTSLPLSDLNVGDTVSVYAVMQGRVCTHNGALASVCQILLSDAHVGR